MRSRLSLLLLALVATGCHTFQPTSVDELLPGQAVRARVTGAFSDSLGTLLLREDAREFEAVVVDGTGTSVFLDVPVQPGMTTFRGQALAQRVEIPQDAFVEVEVKELDRARTFGMVAAVGVVIGSLVIAELTSGTGGADRPGPGGPVDAIISLPIAGLSWIFGR